MISGVKERAVLVRAIGLFLALSCSELTWVVHYFEWVVSVHAHVSHLARPRHHLLLTELIHIEDIVILSINHSSAICLFVVVRAHIKVTTRVDLATRVYALLSLVEPNDVHLLKLRGCRSLALSHRLTLLFHF